MRVVAAIGWAVVAVLGGIAALRLAAHDAQFVLVAINMFSFWLYLPAYLVLPVAALLRRRALALGAAALVATHLAFVLPGFFGSGDAALGAIAPGDSRGAPAATRFRFVAANVLYCNDQPGELFRELLRTRADVMVVSEHSQLWEDILGSPEARSAWPHRIVHTQEDAFGIALYSRWPLEGAELVDVLGVPIVRATVRIGERPVRFYGAHPLPPRKPDYHARWERQLARVQSILARERGAVVVGADLNASPHNAWYARLTSGRFRGAHEDRGRGLATTWPNGLFPLPPVRLDHVLVSPEIHVLDVREGVGAGSDHQPVIADLAIRTTLPVRADTPE